MEDLSAFGEGSSLQPAGRCMVCGGPMTAHDRVSGATCRQMSCRTILAMRAKEAARRQRQAEVDMATAWLGERGLAGDDVVVGVVPAISRTLAPTDPEWIESFRQRLTDAMQDAALLTPEPPSDAPPASVDLTAVLGFGCGMCAGQCCQRGGDHAFLDAEELALKLAALPEATPETLLADYIAAVPEASMAGSCIYHGERGCVLPRDRRSRICNSWACEGLERWREDILKAGGGRLTAVSVEGGAVRRAVVLENGKPPKRLA